MRKLLSLLIAGVLTLTIGAWSVNEGGKGSLGPILKEGTGYVTVDKIGTVSIRDVRIADADIDGDGKPDPGAGPEAVVACGKVVRESTRAGD